MWHLKKDCRNRKGDNNRVNIIRDDDNMCFGVMQQRPKCQWYVDSAATNHMCCEEKCFFKFKQNGGHCIYGKWL